jgi:hypothetical protein
MAKLITIESDDLATIHGGDDAGNAATNAGAALSQSGHDIYDQLHQGSQNFKQGDWLGALGHDLRATYDVAAAGPKLVGAIWPK